MAKQIVIFLRQHDSVDELRPYLELLAQPGSSVLFLYSLETNLFPWWSEGILPSADREGGTQINVLSARVLTQWQAEAVEQRVAGVRALLETKEVTVRLEPYSGRFSHELAKLSRQNAKTVVLRCSRCAKVASCLGFSYVRRWLACNRVAPIRLSLVQH